MAESVCVLLLGILCRWALNNVATYSTPACLPTLAQLKSDPSFMSRMASATRLSQVPDFDMQQSGDAYQVRASLPGATLQIAPNLSKLLTLCMPMATAALP